MNQNVIQILSVVYSNREMLLHDEVVFNTNGTISMVPKHPLVWSEELSMGNREDDMFMLPNIALLVSVYIIFYNFLICKYRLHDILLIDVLHVCLSTYICSDYACTLHTPYCESHMFVDPFSVHLCSSGIDLK